MSQVSPAFVLICGFKAKQGSPVSWKSGSARREVAEAIQALWQELQWLESNKPSDNAARKTLDATLKAAAAELEDPALLFMRPDVAVQRVKGITEQVKSTCAKVESLKIEAIYRFQKGLRAGHKEHSVHSEDLNPVHCVCVCCALFALYHLIFHDLCIVHFQELMMML